ncbi:hypothetical protein QJ48_10915 [Paenibacillus sp. A3]|nr:hypothetical protein QJ48_10915 [Paenibacillus sp. A3]
MTGIDIAFCLGLLKEVGDDLYAKFAETQGTLPHDFEELAQRFRLLNGQAEEVGAKACRRRHLPPCPGFQRRHADADGTLHPQLVAALQEEAV